MAQKKCLRCGKLANTKRQILCADCLAEVAFPEKEKKKEEE